MARLFFLLLILGNLMFFVVAQGYLSLGDDPGREPARLKEQLQADRLQVTVRDEAAPAAPAVSSVPVQLCRRVGPLASVDAEKLKKLVLEKGGAANAVATEDASYWVYIPATGGKEGGDKKSQELKQLGVSDFFIVNDEGVNRGAISLGLFHQESAAKDMLQQLTKKGVRSAKISTKVRKTDKAVLNVRGSQELIDTLFDGLTTKAVDCPAE